MGEGGGGVHKEGRGGRGEVGGGRVFYCVWFLRERDKQWMLRITRVGYADFW